MTGIALQNPILSASPDVEPLFDFQRRHDALGHTIHTWAAAGACFCMGGPITAVQIGMIPLAVVFTIRLIGTGRFLSRFGGTLLAKLLVAWAVWLAISALWSASPELAVREVADLRTMLLVPMLWPVLDRRRTLVFALLAGMLVGVGAQALRGFFPGFLLPPSNYADPDRMSGWWQPVVGGSILTATLGLYLPAAVLGWTEGGAKGVRTGVLGAAGVLLTGAAVVATGSRGAWLASAALVGIVGVLAVLRLRPGRRHLGVLPFFLAIAVLLGVGFWRVMGPAVERRFDRGVQEVREAVEHKRFTTDTGARLLMAWWAMEAVGQRPLHGVGAGGYSAWVRGHLTEQGIDPASRHVHDHAHNTLLHVAATTGAVGAGIFAGMIVVVLRGEGRRLRMGAAVRGHAGTWDVGPACALLGFVLVSPFDTLQVNSQTAAWLWLLVGLCNPARPAPFVLARGTTVDGATGTKALPPTGTE